MYAILIYDVSACRDAKVLKCCRKYLMSVQRSSFEGFITDGKLKELKEKLDKIIDVKEDFVCIYEMKSPRFAHKELIGKVSDRDYLLI